MLESLKMLEDSLIYYFPETSEIAKWPGFKTVLESAITMILSHDIINAKLAEEKLPPVDYRISADYGKVEIVKSILIQVRRLWLVLQLTYVLR